MDAWPTDAEVGDYARSAGLADCAPAGGDALFGPAVAAAIAEWERRTHFKPFLAGATEARPFAYPQTSGYEAPLLDFGTGLLPGATVSVGTSVLTENVHFVFGPKSAAANGRPYTYLTLGGAGAGSYFGGQTSVSFGGDNASLVTINGRWGFADHIPDEVWHAVLGYALARVAPTLALRISSGIYKIGDVQYAGGSVTPLSAEAAEWRRAFNDAVPDYRRLRM